jgi:CheY-like chemotaxis protein
MSNIILVVDDDVDFTIATKTILESKGYTVIIANNGEDGYLKAKSESPGLILLDVNMSHESEGLEVARKIKVDPVTQKIPVFLLNGLRKEMGLSYTFEPDGDWLPVKAVVEKPFNPKELLKLVAKTIA